jgi:hypothetical protein
VTGLLVASAGDEVESKIGVHDGPREKKREKKATKERAERRRKDDGHGRENAQRATQNTLSWGRRSVALVSLHKTELMVPQLPVEFSLTPSLRFASLLLSLISFYSYSCGFGDGCSWSHKRAGAWMGTVGRVAFRMMSSRWYAYLDRLPYSSPPPGRPRRLLVSTFYNLSHDSSILLLTKTKNTKAKPTSDTCRISVLADSIGSSCQQQPKHPSVASKPHPVLPCTYLVIHQCPGPSPRRITKGRHHCYIEFTHLSKYRL